MTTLADIFREHGPSYQSQHGSRLLPSHRQAIAKIVQCRTAALGGHVYHCETCCQRQLELPISDN